MNLIENIVSVGNDILWSYLLIALLIVAGAYFTVASGFVQFKYIGEMFRLLTDKETIKTGKKTVSSFQAFCISTASRVGTGNLAGVASAIALGGPGAIFWMWLIALLGSATAFIESTLAQIYKVKDGDSFRGGPAYYMEKALGARWLGIIFAILITFCFGLVFNSVQSNTISMAMNSAFGSDTLLVGIIVAILTAAIIFGGVHRIAKVTAVVVPVMALIYLFVALIVIVMNFTAIPSVFVLIFKSAFGLEQAIGGGVGAAMMMGIKRGLFSNEAGMGSAPNAAATANVSHPAKQGLIQSLGVFVDTLIICSATAFIILISGDFANGMVGIELTQNALASQIGSWASMFVAIAIFLFAFSSIIGNYYYGETNIEFIKKSKISIMIYRLAVIGMVLFGALAEFYLVWDMADFTMGLMALMNILVIFLLGKFAFAALSDYGKQRKAGKNPEFLASSIPGLKNVEHWQKSDHEQKEKL
ncbi:alanine:cation symporter family protein [Alkalihalobacillus sp. MEB130]|uniref:alanine/glycine:cation symporter family protein n=1 Tax=Alkalihalobacillus sp. MEB130 TaxID=2976704 RepID=UPI0028DE67C8|nr:alanine/glycine:cation symporter family protein [Alkalihalobacillus sp. MEB130]MDT8860246.1 alanine:cation symporter family protein [Alkalihalobacillus sp. MEB130]